MANRSMDAKYKRAIKQRQELGALEGYKPAYSTNKQSLRLIAASADPAMVKREIKVTETVQPVMVLYNPRQPQHKLPVMWAAMKACDGELVKRGDYLAR